MSLRVDFRASFWVDDEECENYLTETAGEITALVDDNEVHAGSLRLFYADIEGASLEGCHPHDLLDLHAATEPYYSVCFNSRSNELRTKLSQDSVGRNLLILDRLELLPQFRGKRNGLAILFRCIQQFARFDAIAVLKCFPLQFEHRAGGDEAKEWRDTMQMDALGGDQRMCTAKLRNYYIKLGFKSIGRTDFMFLNPALSHPTLKDLNLTTNAPAAAYAQY